MPALPALEPPWVRAGPAGPDPLGASVGATASCVDLASCKRMWMAAWPDLPPGGARWAADSRNRTRNRVPACAAGDPLVGLGRTSREGRCWPRRLSVRADGLCSDFHYGTGARNSVSSSPKRWLPPRDTDKDLIKGSESHLSWPGARALLSRIARGKGTERGFSSRLKSCNRDIPLPGPRPKAGVWRPPGPSEQL